MTLQKVLVFILVIVLFDATNAEVCSKIFLVNFVKIIYLIILQKD